MWQNNFSSVSFLIDGIVIDTHHNDLIQIWNDITNQPTNHSYLYQNYCAQKCFDTWKRFVIWKRFNRTLCCDAQFLAILPAELWEKIFKFVAFEVEFVHKYQFILNP